MTQHVISALSRGATGEAARITAMFSRRGFDVESLTVGKSEDPHASRVTVVVDAHQSRIEQIVKQLEKMLEVTEVLVLSRQATVSQSMLVKVCASRKTRSELIQLAQTFRAGVVDISSESLTIETSGDTKKLETFLGMLKPFGIKELVRSGVIALQCGAECLAAADSPSPATPYWPTIA
ncbi:acetolactate synthase small subunit [Streptomyces sp. cg2]|uniref:acetolactate synthase small subunit n=1 Tax=Streptomyces sp. cg2 TaxID=3238799 RepID=UPI0034E2757A